MIKKIPNILCISRIVLIPIILILLIYPIIPSEQSRFLISGLIYAVAMLTDLFDGKIARKYDAVTDFGKFLDPIADKMLVLSVLIAFIQLQIISTIPVVLILTREFIVTGLRLAAVSKNGNVIAANMWGKIKTTSQGIAIGIIFIVYAFGLVFPWISTVLEIMIWLVAIYTIISAIPYYMSCRKYITD